MSASLAAFPLMLKLACEWKGATTTVALQARILVYSYIGTDCRWRVPVCWAPLLDYRPARRQSGEARSKTAHQRQAAVLAGQPADHLGPAAGLPEIPSIKLEWR
jgi:hypothetical protein